MFGSRFFPLSFYMVPSLLRSLFASVFVIFLPVSLVFGQTIVYVTSVGTNGNGSGSSWANAVRPDQLRTRLSSAAPGTQFWIAKGEYKTSINNNNNRNDSYVIPSGVQVYGGFQGYETSLAERELTQPSSTTFSGDVGTIGVADDNAFHVVTFVNASSSTRIDGVVVKNGYGSEGGGIYNNGSGAGNRSDPVIANCYITGNTAVRGGGIMNNGYQGSANPTITNCIITSNTAFNDGGGVYNTGYQGQCNPVVVNCLSFGNRAGYGGAYYNEAFGGVCQPVFRNCTIANNTTSRPVTETQEPQPGNGALYNSVPNGQGNCSPTLLNCLIWGNTTQYPSGLNTSIYNKGPANVTITYSTVQEGFPGTGNDSQNPNFMADYRLSVTSPAINSGDPNSTTATVSTTDLAGRARVFGGRIDKGAYEYRRRYENGDRLYVTTNGAGDGSGSSWVNALPGSQLAAFMLDAYAGASFWIAAGTYKPTSASWRNLSFRIGSGVQVYGGFSGNETELIQRNISANTTLFSGDIGVSGERGDNSYHVVVFTDGSDIARLDGVVIRGGNANAPSAVDKGRLGGGIYIGQCSPAIVNCSITNNYASDGGGIYIGTYSSSGGQKIYVDRCVVKDNSANYGGGIDVGIYAFRGIYISNTAFLNNSAVTSGGGFSNGSEAECVNCLFAYNSARYGGAFLGTTLQTSVRSTLTNCTILNNTASEEGGGIQVSANYGVSSTIIKNSIISNNTAPTGSNLLFNGGAYTITYSNIQGGFAGNSNIDANPLFVDAANGNYQLQVGSPSVNTGDPATTTNDVGPLDLAGNPRIDNGRIDMGAYERQTSTGPFVTVQDGNWNDPATWQQQRIPGAGDAVLIRHRVSFPASYVGNARTVEYDVSGQVIFSDGAKLRLD